MLTSQECYSKGPITQLYNILRENHKESSENKRQAWIRDINMDILLDDWKAICLNEQTQTQLRLLKYNWVMRIYITPVRLHKIEIYVLDATSFNVNFFIVCGNVRRCRSFGVG